MVFATVKISSILIVFLFFCGLQVDCKVEKYVLNIVENGTRVNQEVEVDVDEQTEVIRVPKHNNVDALELMNDFITGFSARRDPVSKVCYVSKLDPSIPPPGKMKRDLDQASRQSLPNKVKTERAELRVVGFADRTALSKKILKFCGTFPIYDVEEKEFPMEILNVSRREISGRVRIKRGHDNLRFRLCSPGNLPKLEHCLKKAGHIYLTHNCTTDTVNCFYLVRCSQGQYPGDDKYFNYSCTEVAHKINYFGVCCTVSC